MAQVRRHAQGDPEAKASEMEHAIRKHCTVHFDEDPAFYKLMSEKLERLIQQHGKNWDLLADEYEQLRSEVDAGRTETVARLDRADSTFYDHVVGLAFDGAVPAGGDAARLTPLRMRVVGLQIDRTS